MSHDAPFSSEPNPYEAPKSAGAGTGAHWTAAPVIELLRETRPWILLFSIVGFIATALIICVGLLGAIGALGEANAMGSAEAVVMALMGMLYFFPSLYLWRFAQRIRDLTYSHSVADLEAALRAQKSFWRFCGILAVLVLALYAVMIAVAAVAFVMSTAR